MSHWKRAGLAPVVLIAWVIIIPLAVISAVTFGPWKVLTYATDSDIIWIAEQWLWAFAWWPIRQARYILTGKGGLAPRARDGPL